ncbi:MAG: hypothetical protein AABY03_01570 [Nanoarchaeota archaeon]
MKLEKIAKKWGKFERNFLVACLVSSSLIFNSACLVPVSTEKKSDSKKDNENNSDSGGTGNIHGTVLSSRIEGSEVLFEPYVDPNLPCYSKSGENAYVNLTSTDSETHTDSNGEYYFQDVPEGVYEIGAGICDLDYPMYAKDKKTIAIYSGETTEAADLRVVTKKILTGKIRHENGNPFIGNLEIDSNYVEDSACGVNPNRPFSTSSNGDYAVERGQGRHCIVNSDGIYTMTFDATDTETVHFSDDYKIITEDLTAIPNP